MHIFIQELAIESLFYDECRITWKKESNGIAKISDFNAVGFCLFMLI